MGNAERVSAATISPFETTNTSTVHLENVRKIFRDESMKIITRTAIRVYERSIACGERPWAFGTRVLAILEKVSRTVAESRGKFPLEGSRCAFPATRAADSATAARSSRLLFNGCVELDDRRSLDTVST